MAKPWAKYEIDYINHDKFRAINANAIGLWHEGKNYCDLRLTDGLIPEATAKHFRFYGKKSLAMLTTSCGAKPGTDETYAPLWERVEGFGFKMHDYLLHNDCRETVLERLAKGEDEKKRKAANLKAWRDQQKANETALKPAMKPAVQPEIAVSDPVSETAQTAMKPDKQKQLQIQKQKTDPEEEQTKSGGGVTARSKRPIYASDRFAVFEWQFDELAKILGPHLDDFDLHVFFDSLTQQSRLSGLVIPKTDVWAWVQAQVVAEAKRRGLPMISTAAAPSNKRIDALVRGGDAFLKRSAV